MSLEVNTATIRRLRDALIENGQLAAAKKSEADPIPMGPREEATLKRVAPFAETMYLMMMADGEADKAEMDAIRGAFAMLTDGFIEPSTLDQLWQGFDDTTTAQGVEFRLQSLGAQLSADRQDRESAFTLAAAVAVADNQVVAGETDLMSNIAEWFGISNKRAKAIIQQVSQTD